MTLGYRTMSEEMALETDADFCMTIKEEAPRGEPSVPWPEGTRVWVAFDDRDGTIWEPSTLDLVDCTAVFSIDKEAVNALPKRCRYNIFLHKPDDGHDLDVKLRKGMVIRDD